MKISRKIVCLILVILTTFFACSCGRRTDYIARNYNHNISVINPSDLFDEYGYIYDQDLTEDYWYGDGTSNINGCGWISTYNANVMLGVDELNIPNIIKYYDENGVLFGGIFGTSMNSIKDYYDDRNFKTELVSDTNLFDEKARNADACIILYITLSGSRLNAHFITLKYSFDSADVNIYLACNFFAYSANTSMNWILTVSNKNRSWQMLTINHI